jgi:hypothetical protein
MQVKTNAQLDNVVLAHEKLDAYQLALEFLEVAQKLIRRLPRTKGQLGDQLARAGEGKVWCCASRRAPAVSGARPSKNATSAQPAAPLSSVRPCSISVALATSARPSSSSTAVGFSFVSFRCSADCPRPDEPERADRPMRLAWDGQS